ncbi:histidinol-phosphate aminotransferase [Leucobacter exalbidus]|uniref:Aromatic amino acid aminotransferase n=1 Tax=Leucobacter exalbidus TaxID=662960 RepID=A0A940PZF2_9MICO|nr:histidinol-phosphate transaminase [Leucobacter exalbidus]MBP1326936.1 histidinol-phosphate aminotransferase [Leucobacter exalbidus]
MTGLSIREDLAAIPEYRQGKSASADLSDLETYKISSNENPYTPLPSVQTLIAELAGTVNRYPDSSGAALVGALSEQHGVATENIVLGSGSIEIMSQLIRATAGPGDEVLFAWRSFEAYPMLVRAGGAEPVMVPLDADLCHDLDAMLAAITDRTRLILVCNPNNPTGTTVSAEALERFLEQVPENITVVIDEAYQHFNRQEDAPVGVEIFKRRSNIAVAHTFSKAYGLAGLRVGYAIAPAPLARAMRAVAIPFGVTAFAQAAAVLSLEVEDELQVRVDALIAERERVVEALALAGVSHPETQANFVWLPLGEATPEAATLLEQAGLIVRPFPGEGLRATIAETEANDRLIAFAKSLQRN